jgi:hypothetical protein
MHALDRNRSLLLIIGLIFLMLYWRALPPVLVLLALAGGGGYLLYRGWKAWHGAGGDRVTYWRGRRIDLPSGQRSGIAGPALLYLVPGSLLVLLAGTLLLRLT